MNLTELVEDFEDAVRAHEMKGSRPTSEHDAIEEEYERATVNLLQYESSGMSVRLDIASRFLAGMFSRDEIPLSESSARACVKWVLFVTDYLLEKEEETATD